MTTAERVLHLLARAGPAGLTIENLRDLLRVPRRDVESAIEDLRLAGNAVVGGPHGVRLTTDPDELARYLDARRRRLVSQYAGTRALRAVLRGMRDQAAAADGLTLWKLAG